MEGLRKVLKDSGITRCQVKYDGSVEDSDAHGIEVTILFNTKTGWSKLDSLCEILNDYNAYVNKTCGLHVHLDVRHLKPAKAKLMGRRLNRALPVLKYLVDKSRHNNSYCNLGMSGFSRNADRYYAINMTSYFKFKTIEVRLHGGSTNFDKIKSWIEILQFVSARPMPKTGLNFQDLIDMGLPEHLIEYADKRITKLHGEAAWRVLIPAPTAPPAAAAQPTPAVQPETAA
jgi:hypothetical protein